MGAKGTAITGPARVPAVLPVVPPNLRVISPIEDPHKLTKKGTSEVYHASAGRTVIAAAATSGPTRTFATTSPGLSHEHS